MTSSEDLLKQAAVDGTFESEDWPRVLEYVFERLDKIYASEFPPPTLPPDPPPLRRLGSPISNLDANNSSQESATSNKENTPAKSSTPRPPVPSFTQSSSTTQAATSPSNSQNAQSGSSPSYPPDIVALYQSIRNTLKNSFPSYPPYSVQRLAELILEPRQHYRYLPPYLKALDRTVSVSSNTSIFPLALATVPNTGLLNGTSIPNHTSPTIALGSDESLGGALLTPIPWLSPVRDAQAQRAAAANNDRELQRESTEIVDGPNGAGRIETVSVVNGVMTTVYSPAPVPIQSTPSTSTAQQPATQALTEQELRAEGAVTQGELLRQEQEAGVVPVSPRRLRLSDEEMRIMDADEQDEDEKPHARGPEEIGMEDLGPQEKHAGAGLDMEHAVGRHKRAASVERELRAQEASPSPSAASDSKDSEMTDEVAVPEATAEEVDKKIDDEDTADADAEIVVDADAVAAKSPEADKSDV